MERGRGGTALALAAAAVCFLCCLGGGASAYSVPADPRHPTWQPSPAPAAARRGYYNGPAASPRQHHRGVSPAPATPHYSAPAPASPRQHHRGISPAPATPHYSAPAPAPRHISAPAPIAGADGQPSLLPPVVPVYSRAPEPQQATTTPHFGFPLEPTVGVAAARPAGGPGSGGEGYPFIGSNPTVPLPTGVTDTATVRPLPDTGGHADDGKEVGRAAAPVRARAAMIGFLVVFSTVLLSWSSS